MVDNFTIEKSVHKLLCRVAKKYGALLTCVYFVIVCFVEDLYLCEVYYLFFG